MEQLNFLGGELLRYNKKAKFLFFDFETEGLNMVMSRPWELSYLVGSIEKGIHMESENFLYYKDLYMPNIIRELCHFDDDRYNKNAQDPRKVLLEFNNIIEQCDFICGHNILRFDSGIYINSCKREGVKTIDFSKKIIDTLPLLKASPGKLNIKKKPDENLLDFQIRVNNIQHKAKGYATLNALCKDTDVEYEISKAHRGIYDININWEAFKKLLFKIEI